MGDVTWVHGVIIFLLTVLVIRTFQEKGTPQLILGAVNTNTSHEKPLTVVASSLTQCPTCPACPACSSDSKGNLTINAVAPVKYSVKNRYCGEIIQERQPWNLYKRVIALSLFADSSGNVPEFLIHGLRQNIIAAKKVYPEWLLRIYTIDVKDSFVKEFANESLVEIVKCVNAETTAKKMLWRFLVYDDPKVELSMSRDLDGRFTYREMFAVHDWISSGVGFHAMRDHPQHVIPIMGGMFGMRRGVLKDQKMESIVAEALTQYPGKSSIPGCCADDQNFLTNFLWPKVSGDALSTDSSVGRCFGAKLCRDFPIGPRTDVNFIGNPFKESKTGTEKCQLTCTWEG